MKKIIVFYHAQCRDGFGAAWVAWKRFGNTADYVAIKASQTPDQLGKTKPKGKEIYFLDVCISPAKLDELVKNNRSVTVIDHHTTNREAVKRATQWYFDLKHSGSVLSWMYFNPKKPVPWLLRYVEDNDLWNFKLPGAEAITVWLRFLNQSFKEWSIMARNFENPSARKKYAKEGTLLVRYRDSIVERILENAYEVKFKGYLAKVANASVSHSEVGHRLIDKKHPIGITWHDLGTARRFSLRSKGDMDVSKLARQFPGGGGHKHASGFTLPVNKPFPWKIVKKK